MQNYAKKSKNDQGTKDKKREKLTYHQSSRIPHRPRRCWKANKKHIMKTSDFNATKAYSKIAKMDESQDSDSVFRKNIKPWGITRVYKFTTEAPRTTYNKSNPRHRNRTQPSPKLLKKY